jgi:hypothetical protein
VDEQAAYELAGAGRAVDAQKGGEDTEPGGLNFRHDSLESAVEELIPDTEGWLVREGDPYPELFAVADGSLFVVTCDPCDAEENDQGFRVKVMRRDADELDAALSERLEMTHGTSFRQRRWTFATDGGAATLEVRTEENLGSSGGPDRDELLARALAGATGWPRL